MEIALNAIQKVPKDYAKNLCGAAIDHFQWFFGPQVVLWQLKDGSMSLDCMSLVDNQAECTLPPR